MLGLISNEYEHSLVTKWRLRQKFKQAEVKTRLAESQSQKNENKIKTRKSNTISRLGIDKELVN